MDEKQIKRIPYGVSDYEQIVEKDFYYIDKTRFLPLIAKTGLYLFFIRPRRFGKSLFLTMMKAYYDVSYKNQFEKLFKGTWIFDNPTEERGNYLVLFLNFSEVSPSVNKVEESFLALIRRKVRDFIDRYRSLLSESPGLEASRHSIEESNSPSDILGELNQLVKSASQKMVVIIDEYDNFSNTLLIASGDDAYRDLTHGDGFLRTFFNVLKAGTGDVGSPIARLFITGVSPVTMDEVTSGFNIGESISLNFNLNQMLGFTRDDVVEMIEYYRNAGKISHTTDELVQLMTLWNGNYLFSADDNVPMFNSDMVLYFLKNYMQLQKLPKNLIDRNVRIDYKKLRHLIIMDQDESNLPVTNGNFSKLKEI
ncbi:MAG: AAA family ATPase, partial [bacterium]|nr:AAA family ATPase [bacterium]